MSVTDLKTVFNHLIGKWAIERNIQTPDGHGFFKGACVFTEMEDGRLLCEENGLMTINGHTNEAKRSYIYAYESDSDAAGHKNDRIVILYNDPHRRGEMLHELTFSIQGDAYVAKHCHLCGQDTYDLKFTMTSENVIHMNYEVKGPHKNYAMQSTLRRNDI